MDLSKLQKVLEAGPARIRELAAEIETRQKRAKTLEFFMEAVRLLRVSWKDEDPGKYTSHWYCFRKHQKIWPRELIDARGTTKKPREPSLCAFIELDRRPCPHCENEGLDVGCYEQVEDGSFGDIWMKTRYVLCAACAGLYEVSKERRGHRF